MSSYPKTEEEKKNWMVMCEGVDGVFRDFSVWDIENGKDIFGEKQHKNNTPSFVYVISSNGAFKIGKSNNPKKRLTELQVAHPFELELVFKFEIDTQSEAFEVEKILHDKFSNFRLKGEWFKDECLNECLDFVRKEYSKLKEIKESEDV